MTSIYIKANISLKDKNQYCYYKISNNEIYSLSEKHGYRKIKMLPQIESERVFVSSEIEFTEKKKEILNALGV